MLMYTWQSSCSYTIVIYCDVSGSNHIVTGEDLQSFSSHFQYRDPAVIEYFSLSKWGGSLGCHTPSKGYFLMFCWILVSFSLCIADGESSYVLSSKFILLCYCIRCVCSFNMPLLFSWDYTFSSSLMRRISKFKPYKILLILPKVIQFFVASIRHRSLLLLISK